MQTKNLHGINNKSKGVGVVRMYVTTFVTNKLQVNPVHLLQFLPNLHNWTSLNQLFQVQLASSKRMVIWQTLRFTDKLWKEHTFEYESSAILFTICMKVNRSIRTPGLWVVEVVTYICTTPLLSLLIPYMFISDKVHHKTLKHLLPQSLVHVINDDIQRKNATYLPAQ